MFSPPVEANVNKLMNSSMLGLAPIAPTETLITSKYEEQPATESNDPFTAQLLRSHDLLHFNAPVICKPRSAAKSR